MVLKEINGKLKKEETKKDKRIKRVLHRLLSEENTKIRKSLERIDTLNHQAQYFSEMFQYIQDGVEEEMFNLMKENGWNDWIKELKEELKKENKNE